MKLLNILCWIGFSMAGFAIANDFDPWSDHTKVTEVKFGEDSISEEYKLSIRLLEPLASIGGGDSGAQVGEKTISLYHKELGDHGFVYTSDGDLFVDNLFAGRFMKSDDLRYGYGRIWANGKPCVLAPLTENQKKLLFEDWEVGGVVNQVEREPWKVFISPFGTWGGSHGHHIIWNGMTVLRFEGGTLNLQGVPYGTVTKGDEVRIVAGAVYINGQLRSPTSPNTNKGDEQVGAHQPATKPADKAPAKDQPSPPTPKAGPR